MVTEKIETLVVFMEGKKKKLNHLVPRLGPFRRRGGFRRGGLSSALRADDHGRRDEIPPDAEKGPAWAPGGFNLFYFCLP